MSAGKLKITWKKQLSLDFPHAMGRTGKMRFRASLAFNFPKQADPLFVLSIIFLWGWFSDILFCLKWENILNVSTKQSLMFPGNSWLIYLDKHSCIYLLLVYCMKTHQIFHACYAGTFCASHKSKCVLLCSYKKVEQMSSCFRDLQDTVQLISFSLTQPTLFSHMKPLFSTGIHTPAF